MPDASACAISVADITSRYVDDVTLPIIYHLSRHAFSLAAPDYATCRRAKKCAGAGSGAYGALGALRRRAIRQLGRPRRPDRQWQTPHHSRLAEMKEAE